MAETIREYVKRRRRLSERLLALASVLALVPLVIAVRMTRGPHPYLHAYFVALFASLALTCVAMTVVMRTTCPKCGKQLVVPRPFGAQPNYCPYCAVNLDEPMPQKRISPGSQAFWTEFIKVLLLWVVTVLVLMAVFHYFFHYWMPSRSGVPPP
jgi:hypothetical protein